MHALTPPASGWYLPARRFQGCQRSTASPSQRGVRTPFIDFDSTAILALGLFIVLLLLLSQLMFKPYLKVRDARSAGIEGAREQAVHMDEQARAAGTDYDRKFTEARKRATEERARLRAQAQEDERRVTQEARTRMREAMETSRQTLSTEKQQAEATLTAETQLIAQKIASRLLGREVQA